MGSLWISLFFLSVSWLFTVHVFTPPHWLGAVFVGCGVAFGILAFRKTKFKPPDRKWALCSVPLLLASIFTPFPFNLGAMLLSLGIAAWCFGRRLAFTGLGTAFSGLIISVQSAVIPLYFIFAARCHEAKALAFPAGFLLKLFGLKTSFSGSTVFVQTGTQVLGFATTWEKLGLLPFALILAGGVVILLFAGKKKGILPFLLTLLIYMLVRYLFLVCIYAESGMVELFWSPVAAVLSLALAVPLLIKFFPLESGDVFLPGPLKFDQRMCLSCLLTFLGVFSLAGVWGFHDPGVRKQGRVLVDENHSNWEWTTGEYDTNWFGEKSGYNYNSLFNYINLYYHVERSFEPVTPNLLSGCDVLIIKTPTEPFSPGEIDTIEGFVRAGGGLFLIGDHTNVFGISTNINPLAERFGFHFRHDATYELNSGALSEYLRPETMPHPIVQHLPLFLFATSCTLNAPWSADEVITGYGLKSLAADYSQKNFFPAGLESAEMEFGLFLQAASTAYGKGRVAAFTDSTVFSNFWMFMPGKPELALGTIEWLNRHNSLPDLKLFFLLLTFALLLPPVYYAARAGGSAMATALLLTALCVVPVAAHAYGALNSANYPPPRPHTGAVYVCFEQEHSDFTLPATWQGFNAGPQKQFLTFYVWNQRLGYVPSYEPTLEDALAKGELVVLVKPVRMLTIKEINTIMNYIRQGGRMLLLDDAAGEGTVSGPLLEMFEMKIDRTPVSQPVAYYMAGEEKKEIALSATACGVSGGEALLSTPKGEAIFAVKREGRGMLAVFTDSQLFSNLVMGEVGSVPDEYRMQVSELEFWMLQTLVDYRFEGE